MKLLFLFGFVLAAILLSMLPKKAGEDLAVIGFVFWILVPLFPCFIGSVFF